MGWGIAGGVLGLILMFASYRWLLGWTTARAGGVSIPTIGTRPRRLAGLPEEAPEGAKLPPAMELLRNADGPVIVDEELAEAEFEPISAEADLPGDPTGIEVSAISQGTEDQGEFVVISNNGTNPVSLEGWKLADDNDRHVYEFPSIVLAGESSLRVHMWRGEDTATDLYVGRRSRWWNDDGDTAYLYDPAGALIHALSISSEETVPGDTSV